MDWRLHEQHNRPVYLNAARATDDPSTCPKSHLYLASVLCQNMVGDERVQRMSQWLIDDRGKVWTRVDRLRAALGTALGPAELYKYAVENLGYVAIEDRHRAIWLKLRPRAVSQITLVAVLYWLAECRTHRCVISHLHRRWQHEMLSRADAIERLGDLVVDPSKVRDGDFHRQAREEAVAAPIQELLRRWQADAGAPFSGQCEALLHQAFAGRYMVIKRSCASRRLEIRAVGRGFVVYDDDWLSQAVGLRLEDQPDHYYARWAAEAYHEAASTERPSIDDVDALIERPQQGKARLQYQRLILPHRQPGGDHLLLCASLLDGSIDLRVEAA